MPDPCSVVIPAFNAARFIRRTIDGVLNQTYTDYELIVVDDGSSDETAEIVKSYGPEIRYIHQENAGGGPARNTGIAAAKYDWIALLDHDDWWFPEKLQRQMELLERNPNVRWCGANYYKECQGRRMLVGDTDALTEALAGQECFDDFFAAIHKYGYCMIPSSMMLHKEIFENVGLFDGSWLRWADLDMWWRVACDFPKIAYTPQPLAVMYLEPQDARSTELRMASKRGAETWKLIGQHVERAKAKGAYERYRPIAKKFIRNSLLTTLYHGYGSDSRETVRRFREFFPWYWRAATFTLTICPGLSSRLLKACAWLRHRLGFEKQLSRRWVVAQSESNTTTGLR